VLAQQGWHPHHAAVIDRAAPSADDGAMATIFYTAATLDGFIADEHDSLEWLMRQDIDMEDESAYPHFIAGVGALITGSTTYEWVLREAGTWAYEQATWVLSHRELPTREGVLVRAADSESDLLAIHDEAVAAAAGKDVWCVGGGGVAAALAAVGRLDQLHVQIAPVLLGSGKPLFDGALDLRLVDVVRNRSFVCTVYDVAR
jgi:dihydrofolate reductase